MTPQRVVLLQTLLEALIPAIGYFYWNWDLSFILLFYLLDYVLAFGVVIAKGRKRHQYARLEAERKLWLRHTSAGFALMAAACAGMAAGVQLLHPDLNGKQRIIDFLLYEDMGIRQGYVLVPLIVLNGIIVYRQQFLLPARYRTTTMREITRPFIVQSVVVLCFAASFVAAASLVRFPEEIMIALLIAGTSVYRLKYIRR